MRGPGGEDLAFTLGQVKHHAVTCQCTFYCSVVKITEDIRSEQTQYVDRFPTFKQVICRGSRAGCFLQVYPLNYAKIVVDRGKIAGWRPSSTRESRPCHPRLAHITKFPKPDSMCLSVTNVTKRSLGLCFV